MTILKDNSQMNLITTHNFNESQLRVIADAKGDPWFVAADVCRVLELKSAHGSYGRNLEKLQDHEITTWSNLGVKPKGSGMHVSRLISESGLYKLIMRSNKPQAKPFQIARYRSQNWVTQVVLPSINPA